MVEVTVRSNFGGQGALLTQDREGSSKYISSVEVKEHTNGIHYIEM